MRFPTVDHPKTRNGAVKWMGSIGYCQNHATQTEVSVWHGEGESTVSLQVIQQAAREIADGQREAAEKAKWIISQCQHGKHDYLKAKGFSDEQGYIYVKDGVQLLVIPMWVGRNLVGVQLIDPDGNKRFLKGQRTSNAEFIFNNSGPHYLCEGYATALSLRHILKSLKKTYTIHVCFSAGNLVKVAEGLTGFVIADHDKPNPQTGTRAGHEVVKKIGWPYWMSDTVGEDLNDYSRRVGLFRAGQNLSKAMKNGLLPAVG
jgi:putative DNA primase/helicase